MHRSNHAQHCRKKKYYLVGTNATVLLTGINWLQITRNGWLGFPSACHCRRQLQTPQQLSVHVSTLFGCPQGDVSRKGTYGEVGTYHRQIYMLEIKTKNCYIS
jgi:hypothetical protein